jgi:hypothetical protein
MAWCKNTAEQVPDWESLAGGAIEKMQTPERVLVRRVAEARGRRVSLKELAASFGLPSAPSPEQDFPGLSEFVSARSEQGEKLPMPIVASPSGVEGWYWMSPPTSGAFRRAFRKLDEKNA